MSDPSLPKPPKTYSRFIQRFPQIGQAWESLGEAGRTGPLDDKTQRLLKLAIAAGSKSEGSFHSAVRKAKSAGCSREEMEQVVALSASTIGLPAAVAAWSWINDVLGED